MFSRLWDFVRRLFGHRDNDNTDVTPDPIPDPVDVPDPVTPVTLGLPGQRKPVVLWFERRSAREGDDMIGKYGLSRVRDLVLCGGQDVSVYGRTLRVLHGNVDQKPASFSRWFSENTRNCAGWVLDWEGWSGWPENRQWFLDAVKLTVGKCWVAPQLWLGGGHPFHAIFGQPHEKTVQDMAGADVMLWQYGSTVERWASELQSIRNEGFKGVMVVMTDGGIREGDAGGYNTVAECVRIVHWAADQGLGIGLFMPQLNPEKIRPVLAAIAQRYG